MILYLSEDRKITIGKLGSFEFPRGIYLYVGSAMGGFRKRLKRYLAERRKLRWHIDYLLQYAEIMGILLIPSSSRIEEAVASRLAVCFKPFIEGFGASDANSRTHLFYLGDEAS